MVPDLSAKNRSLRFSWSRILQWAGAAVFIFLVVVPLSSLVIYAIDYIVRASASSSLSLLSVRQMGLLLNSTGLALAVALSGMVIGFLAATVLWRFETGLPSMLRWLILILAPLPLYIHAIAWAPIMQQAGILMAPFGLRPIDFEGWGASWWVQMMSLLPLSTGICLAGLKSIEPKLFDASRVIRSDIRSLFSVVMPLALPALMAGFGILFLMSITDFSVPYFFRMNVYSLEIFAQFTAGDDPGAAFLYSLPLVVITLVVVGLSQHWLRNTAQSKAWNKSFWDVGPCWPSWFRILQWIALALVVIQVFAPLFSLSASIGTWQTLSQSVYSGRNEIFYSIWVAVLAAVLCLPLAVCAAILITKSRRVSWLIWLIVLIPLAVPPPLAGIGLITVWNSPLLGSLYGTSIMPVVGALFRFTSLAAIIIAMQFRYVDPLLIDAAHILQKNFMQTLTKVWLPILFPGLLAAACIVLALTAGELGTTLLLVSPGQATLTIRIYNFLHYGASSNVAGLCLLIVLITFIMALAAMILLGWWWRLNNRPGETTIDSN
jgi:iron(III) transport system permease protein